MNRTCSCPPEVASNPHFCGTKEEWDAFRAKATASPPLKEITFLPQPIRREFWIHQWVYDDGRELDMFEWSMDGFKKAEFEVDIYMNRRRDKRVIGKYLHSYVNADNEWMVVCDIFIEGVLGLNDRYVDTEINKVRCLSPDFTESSLKQGMKLVDDDSDDD